MEDMKSMDNRIKEQIEKISFLDDQLASEKNSSATLRAMYEERISKMEQQMVNGNQRETI